MVSIDVQSFLLVIFGALLSILGTLFGIYLKSRMESKKIKIQSREKALTHVIDSRFDAMKDVNDEMVETYFILNRLLNIHYNTQISQNEFDKAREAAESFEDIVNKSEIWMRDDIVDALNKVRGQFRLALDELWRKLSTKQPLPAVQIFSWEEFSTNFQDAKKKIKEAIGTTDLESHLKAIFE